MDRIGLFTYFHTASEKRFASLMNNMYRMFYFVPGTMFSILLGLSHFI